MDPQEFEIENETEGLIVTRSNDDGTKLTKMSFTKEIERKKRKYDSESTKKPFNPSFVRNFTVKKANGDVTIFVFTYDPSNGECSFAGVKFRERDQQDDSDSCSTEDSEVNQNDVFNKDMKKRLFKTALYRFEHSPLKVKLTQVRNAECADEKKLFEREKECFTKSLYEVRKCIERLSYEVGLFRSRRRFIPSDIRLRIKYWKKDIEGKDVLKSIVSKKGKTKMCKIRVQKVFKGIIDTDE